MNKTVNKGLVFFVLIVLSLFGKAGAYNVSGTRWEISPVTFFTT